MRTHARFPEIASGAGHYESFYIKACRPGGGEALWIRHTVHKRPDEEPSASLWLTHFDADEAGPRATKITYPASELSVPTGAYIKVGEATLDQSTARGSIPEDSLPSSWDLTFTDEGEAFHHLPSERMYRAKLPRTKLLSPYPGARFSGTAKVGDREIALDGWPGMIGHNWGAEHAERWIWLHAADLGGNPGDYLDIAAGKIKIGPWTTPWISNGVIVLDGEQYRLGGLDRIYGLDLEETENGLAFEVPGKGVNAKGTISAPAKDFVGWVYADPKGPEHNVVNCSIADLELKVERAGERHARLEVPGGTAYELGMRETDHGVPLQPFPDG
jgi:hypothetical protein